jgi:hypothetical protein
MPEEGQGEGWCVSHSHVAFVTVCFLAQTGEMKLQLREIHYKEGRLMRVALTWAYAAVCFPAENGEKTLH